MLGSRLFVLISTIFLANSGAASDTANMLRCALKHVITDLERNTDPLEAASGPSGTWFNPNIPLTFIAKSEKRSGPEGDIQLVLTLETDLRGRLNCFLKEPCTPKSSAGCCYDALAEFVRTPTQRCAREESCRRAGNVLPCRATCFVELAIIIEFGRMINGTGGGAVVKAAFATEEYAQSKHFLAGEFFTLVPNSLSKAETTVLKEFQSISPINDFSATGVWVRFLEQSKTLQIGLDGSSVASAQLQMTRSSITGSFDDTKGWFGDEIILSSNLGGVNELSKLRASPSDYYGSIFTPRKWSFSVGQGTGRTELGVNCSNVIYNSQLEQSERNGTCVRSMQCPSGLVCRAAEDGEALSWTRRKRCVASTAPSLEWNLLIVAIVTAFIVILFTLLLFFFAIRKEKEPKVKLEETQQQ